MNTKEVYFVKAVTGELDTIADGLPQVAFIGRSNVGKSSVINAITGNKSLARSSSTPGRTQELNFFSYRDKGYLVDLPGYGYAKVSRSKKEIIKERILWYFTNSEMPIDLVILIVDAKVGLTIDDIDMLTLLRDRFQNIIVLGNKIDKLNQTEKYNNLQKIQSAIGPHQIIPFSAVKKIGVDELRKIIEAYIK